MTTTSRRLSIKTAPSRPSHTPGREKGSTCQKDDLKTWGRSANPYKLRGGALHRYADYTDLVKGMNK